MKATGIVRRIDDLGRVVIPKEIRRTMNIREGDPLEVYVDNIRDRYMESMGSELSDTQSEIIQQMDGLINLLKQEAKK